MTPTQTVIPFKAKAEGVFVRVPDVSQAHFLFENRLGFILRGITKYIVFYEPIHESTHDVLGLSDLVTESQWAEVVESLTIRIYVIGWVNYTRWYDYTSGDQHSDALATARESGLSLMRSLGITEGNWIVILKRGDNEKD